MFFEHFLAFRRKKRRKMQTRTLGQLAQFDFLLYFCSAIDNYPDYPEISRHPYSKMCNVCNVCNVLT